MSIYYPNLVEDPLNKRPLILLMHGGSFLTGSLTNLDSMCIEFAKRGFVSATIEYRLGWAVTNSCQSVTPNTVISANKAIYRSLQDLHASLRFLTHNASTYKIDTAWIFMGGLSAGSFATSDLAFIDQQQLFNRWPYCQTLGYLNTSGNNLTDTFTVKGLFHNWGSIVDIDYITQSNAIPMIGFAGDMDVTSPIDSGYFQGCTNFSLRWGTRTIYNKIKSYGVCAQMNVKIHGGHGVYNQTYEQNVFRIGKASCFFKSLFCNECQTSYHTDSVSANCSINTTGIIESTKSQLKVYPNPSNGNFTMVTDVKDGEVLYVYDMSGRLVHKEVVNKNYGNTQDIYLPNLVIGIYNLKVGNLKTKLSIQ